MTINTYEPKKSSKKLQKHSSRIFLHQSLVSELYHFWLFFILDTRTSAEVLNVDKIAKSVEINPENEDNEIGFSVKNPKGALQNSDKSISNVVQRNLLRQMNQLK